MKRIFKKLSILIALVPVAFTSCEDYLNVIPKGEKIPETLADFEAMLRYEYGNHRVDVTQALVLLNDRWVSASSLSFYPLDRANYFWDETADRIELNQSDETSYYAGYGAINTFNLVIDNALVSADASENEQREVWAQAKVLRAMTYFNLVNYYADQYDENTASEKFSVPLITSADVNAPYTQVSIQQMYDFMLNDMEEAMPYLPDQGATVLHPDLGTANAFYARLYLQMNNYQMAEAYADEALAQNDDLFDWTVYYEENRNQIEDPESYVRTASPMGFDYIENYAFRHGSSSNATTEYNLTTDRAGLFEEGDARFLSRWKLRTVGADTYYYGTLQGYFNYGGITTVEVYLIKAECLARAGNVDEAMAIVNKIRSTRILPASYSDLTAADEAEAMAHIMRTKRNELIMTIVPFSDLRRWNHEGTYTTTLTKSSEGESYTLSPDSHMWTMPFPQGAVDNPGNGTITQNVIR